MPGLLALFSACTSTDAYSVVSVREFFYLELEFSRKLFLLPFIELSVLRVAFDPSLRLQIEKDNLGQG